MANYELRADDKTLISRDLVERRIASQRFIVLLVRRLWLPVAIVALWGLLSHFSLVNPYLIPSPGAVWEDALILAKNGALWSHLSVSLRRVFLGYTITIAAALPLAILFEARPQWAERFSLILSFLRATPPLALIPILILWFGLGEASKIAVIVLATFFPVFVNGYDGLKRVEGRWHELALSLELSYPERLRFVLLPGALPQIITGLRIGFGYAWRALVGAELFAAASGLGYLIVDSQEMARTDRVVVGILAIGVTGLLFDMLLSATTRKLFPWAERAEGEKR